MNGIYSDNISILDVLKTQNEEGEKIKTELTKVLYELMITNTSNKGNEIEIK